MTVAAAESAIRLAILVVLFRRRSIDVRKSSDEGLSMIRNRYCSPRLAPLFAAILAGLGGRVRPAAPRSVTIAGVALAFGLSRAQAAAGGRCAGVRRQRLHVAGQRRHPHGSRLLVDRLTALMMVVYLRVVVRTHLHDRLHARRSRLPAVLLVSRCSPSPMLMLVANNFLRSCSSAGSRRRRFLSLIGFWYPADGNLREPQGVPGQPRRRLRLRARHRRDRLLHQLLTLDGVRAARRDRGGRAALPAWVAGDDGRLHLPCSSARWAIGAVPLHVWLPD